MLSLYFRVATLLWGNLFTEIPVQLKQLQNYKTETYHLLYTCFVLSVPWACFLTHTLSSLISMDKGDDGYRDYKIFIQNPPRGILNIFVAIYLLKTESKWTNKRERNEALCKERTE